MRLLGILGLLLVVLIVTGCASHGGRSGNPAASGSSEPGGRSLVIHVTFAKNITVTPAVRSECNLERRLSGYVGAAAANQYASIVEGPPPAPANADILDVEIVDVLGAGGGVWSGEKSLVITGTLSRQGRRIGKFEARRMSGGGVWGVYKGTCSILGRCAKALGGDVASWLRQPTPNAVLGDL